MAPGIIARHGTPPRQSLLHTKQLESTAEPLPIAETRAVLGEARSLPARGQVKVVGPQAIAKLGNGRCPPSHVRGDRTGRCGR